MKTYNVTSYTLSFCISADAARNGIDFTRWDIESEAVQHNPAGDPAEIVTNADYETALAAFDTKYVNASVQETNGGMYQVTVSWLDLDEVVLDDDGDPEDYITVQSIYPEFSIVSGCHPLASPHILINRYVTIS